jgi:hypothetical protein
MEKQATVKWMHIHVLMYACTHQKGQAASLARCFFVVVHAGSIIEDTHILPDGWGM